MNILITGACGYIGSQLVKQLQKLNTTGAFHIIATDIRDEPTYELDSHTEYRKLDVRSPEVADLFQEKEIDTVVHLATIVTPGKKSNRAFEYSVDVEGTENTLKACVANQVKQIVVTSSGAAYGYHADNAAWLTEEDPIRGNEEFAYSYHKRLVENMLASYRVEYPELKQTIFRIGTILGEHVSNQITDLFKKRFMIGISGSKSPFVFIWDQDVVACLVKAITERKSGIYNVAGDGAVTVDEIASIQHKKVIRISPSVVKFGLFILKRLRMTQYGEEQVNFLRYRPVLANNKLKETFNFIPTYTSKEAFERYLQGKW